MKAEEIKIARAKLGLSQPEFAKHLEVSPWTVKSWEQGKSKASPAHVKLMKIICESLG